MGGAPRMGLMIGVSQRVTTVAEYVERRDSIDQRWAEFLTDCELIPIFIPNHPATVSKILDHVELDGFLLTGGNNLLELGGDAPERDETELLLLEYAMTHRKPLLGVCRGMQFLQHYFGVQLEEIIGHVRQEHPITDSQGQRTVNSYHQLGTRDNKSPLHVLARAHDGIVESVCHVSMPLQGIMWHPERYNPFVESDRVLFTNFFRNRIPLINESSNP